MKCLKVLKKENGSSSGVKGEEEWGITVDRTRAYVCAAVIKSVTKVGQDTRVDSQATLPRLAHKLERQKGKH